MWLVKYPLGTLTESGSARLVKCCKLLSFLVVFYVTIVLVLECLRDAQVYYFCES